MRWLQKSRAGAAGLLLGTLLVAPCPQAGAQDTPVLTAAEQELILPVLFVVILGPAGCSIADAFASGVTSGGG